MLQAFLLLDISKVTGCYSSVEQRLFRCAMRCGDWQKPKISGMQEGLHYITIKDARESRFVFSTVVL